MQRITNTKALKKLMVERDISGIKELSEKSDINRNTLGAVLNGKMQPSADVMGKLILALDIPPKEAGEIFFSPNLHIA